MRFRYLDEKGMGIVLVLIVVSLVGAASLYLMDMTKTSQKKIVLDARVASYGNLVKMVTSRLHSGNTCTDLLKGTRLVQGSNTAFAFQSGIPISLNLQLPVNPSPLRAPQGNVRWFIEGGTSIKDVRLYVQEKVRAPVRLAASGSPLWTGALGYILIHPGHPGTGMRLARNAFYKIPIFIYFSGTGSASTIESCFDPNGDAYFCTIAGGAYDYQEPDSTKRCQPDRTCFAYKSPLVFNASSCPAPYDALPIGYTVSGQLYICNWCNENTPLLPEEPAMKYFTDLPTNG